MRLLISFLLGFPIGWDREREERSAGVRAFPLVSMGSCGLNLMASRLVGGSGDIQSRVLQGLFTGIGFIGGGAILKHEKFIHGTATAASVWNVAVIGAATGFGSYDIAVILALINLLILRLLRPLKKPTRQALGRSWQERPCRLRSKTSRLVINRDGSDGRGNRCSKPTPRSPQILEFFSGAGSGVAQLDQAALANRRTGRCLGEVLS